MIRLLDKRLDPYDMPLGMTYKGSAHEAAERSWRAPMPTTGMIWKNSPPADKTTR